MKSILFLGGGELGLPAINWAKDIGFNIIVNDRNTEAPGFKLADVEISYDSTNVRGISGWVMNNNDRYNLRYCHCGSDFGLLTSVVINECLGIPHLPIKAVINGLDKNLMKKCWKNKGINYPISYVVNSENETASMAEKLGWPVIIKPTSGSGSQGVSLAENYDEAIFSYREAKKYSKIGCIIVEQFINGSHHDVNGLFWNGEFFPCGIVDRFFTSFPYCVPSHGYFPSSLPRESWNSLYSLLEVGARALGINWGPAKADCVLCNDKFYVYEISPRFHGDILTLRTMGFLKEKNPLYQYFKWIYNGNISSFMEIDSTDTIGGWKAILDDKIPIIMDQIEGIFIKRSDKDSLDLIKNNDQILGLVWAWKSKKEEIDKCLGIDPQK